MPLRAIFFALVMVTASVTAAPGQPVPTSALEDAHRALSGALEQHDRAAFVAVFAPDATCSLPAAAQGPDAIAALWLPFLIDPGTTMILTARETTTAPSGDRATTSGTFAIRGRTAAGVRTIPAGEYSIEWRLVDGRWQIAALGGPVRGERRETTDQGGVGPFRFGMSRAEVSSVAACHPYTTVASTGGLECPSYTFDGQTMNVSFFFTANRLTRIQLWYYEGGSAPEARDAVGRVLDFMQRTTGGTAVCSKPGVEVTPDGVMRSLDGAPPPAGRMARLDIGAATSTDTERWFSRVARHEYGYLVMLFADPRTGP